MPPLTSLLSRTLLFRELSILCCRTSRLLIPRADAVILIGTAPDKPVNIILRGAQTSGRSGRIETENPSGRSGRGIRLARGGRSGLSPMSSTTGGRSGRVVGWCPPVIGMAPASTTRRPQRPGGGMVPASHRDGARQYHRRPQRSLVG
jgi:hypothetical protein